MNTKTMTQLQVRIDEDTKEKAKEILDELGLDASTAVKMLFRQIVKTGTLPLEIRDTDGFRPHKAQELREAIRDAKTSKKTFTTVDAFIKNLSQ